MNYIEKICSLLKRISTEVSKKASVFNLFSQIAQNESPRASINTEIDHKELHNLH